MTLIEMLRANGSWEADAAAARIEKLEEDVGVLIAASIRLSSRIDLDSDHYVDRIKKLEAALREIAARIEYDATFEYKDIVKVIDALEGKDD